MFISKNQIKIRFQMLCAFIIINICVYGYEWPLANQNMQHQITATYGESRIGGFHDGIDIDNGTTAFNVINLEYSKVLKVAPAGNNMGDLIHMYNENYNRSLEYCHLVEIPEDFRPKQGGGSIHIQKGLILGRANTATEKTNHLHLSDGEIYNYDFEQNPLYNLSPDFDNVNPTIEYVKLYKDNSTTQLSDKITIGTNVDIWVKAKDGYPDAGSNNGIYSIRCEITGPNRYFQPFSGFLFNSRSSDSNWIFNNVYAPGSTTGTNIYIVTNYQNSNNWWTTWDLAPGQYNIKIYADDESYNIVTFDKSINLVSSTGVEIPDPPVLISAWSNRYVNPHDPTVTCRAKLKIIPANGVTAYALHWEFGDNVYTCQVLFNNKIQQKCIRDATIPLTPGRYECSTYTDPSGYYLFNKLFIKTDQIYFNKHWVEVESVADSADCKILSLRFPTFWAAGADFNFKMASKEYGCTSDWSETKGCYIVDAPQNITITSPTEGVAWKSGTQHTIEWSCENF